MRRVAAIADRGTWPEGQAAATITLDYDTRCRRRMRIDTDAGEPILLDRPEAGVLRDGDGLRLDDGRWLRVRAKPEALVAVDGQDAQQLLRLAWHLGNRHLPTEIEGNTLYIHRDHVIEDMLRGLGAHLQSVMRPFNPEGGAYDGHAHSHQHHGQPAVTSPRANGKDHGA
jgi:urease accessory protein